MAKSLSIKHATRQIAREDIINNKYLYLFIIQPGGVKAMWPSLQLNQALNKLHIHTQSIQKKK